MRTIFTCVLCLFLNGLYSQSEIINSPFVITSSGGALIQNEYTPYRVKKELWKELKPKFEYKWSSKTGKVERIKNNTENQLIEW